MPTLKTKITEIAIEMAGCASSCEGIVNTPKEGRPPRGLVLETAGRTGAVGAIVVGQNPGKAGKIECQHYVTKGAGYEQQLKAWDDIVGARVLYFVRLRQLLAVLGLDGPILWTDVAKCEGQGPPVTTLMTCSQRFLARELAAAPKEWPAIAAGAKAFQALGYMAGARPVIGIAHPTGSHASNRFLAQKARLSDEPDYRAELQQLARAPSSRVWLS